MTSRLALCAVVVGSLVLSTDLRAADPVGTPHVYKHVDGRDLKLYVSKPDDWKASDQRPAIVFYHGGGWVGGAPGQFTEHAKYFTSRGLVCVQVQYRLLDKKEKDPPTICIQDAKSAMRWVRSHAKELGIDPQRIASAGGSAGGHLAAFLGTTEGVDDPSDDLTVSAKSNAMLLFNPVFDNGPDGWGTARVGNRYQEFSPFHNITKDDPPAIVFLGTKDKLIPVKTAMEFEKKLEEAGSQCRVMLFDGMPHGFFNFGKNDNRPYYETVRASDEFLASLGWLTGKPTIEKPEIAK